MKPTLYLPMLLMLTATAAHADDKPAPAAKQQSEKGDKGGEKAARRTELDRDALEKEFASKLTGSTLVGYFTTDGEEADKPPKADRYELQSVSKFRDDYWVFVASMKYGDKEFKLPITLKVLWAGDTPMISLTDFTIPGMGTFTSRILFYGDRYAGTWQHGDVGGHMFGTIEPAKSADKPVDKKDETEPEASKNGQPKSK